jgi:hypothetical protein
MRRALAGEALAVALGNAKDEDGDFKVPEVMAFARKDLTDVRWKLVLGPGKKPRTTLVQDILVSDGERVITEYEGRDGRRIVGIDLQSGKQLFDVGDRGGQASFAKLTPTRLYVLRAERWLRVFDARSGALLGSNGGE